jgi:hypothetical protein
MIRFGLVVVMICKISEPDVAFAFFTFAEPGLPEGNLVSNNLVDNGFPIEFHRDETFAHMQSDTME